ncbi:uncharacterized protein LOC116302127 [Actinia tenebrosa]|uniref:Uncharacterized protein LOC116302127 n=1 Tax=Actinia tenebrosa TaxID=6105 RepID=A0A6P8ILB4_ACTTE|nr:uncharacterized protein LOC116302127 [Actinia tenebrosa]XP_031567206.1 uncharacterized protein LOC116302127 [Actinia tenebrosa]XP_031567207.1 uncharacterized protein LOC116302127 [Actinia tenebrosa]XP_031567208.1 uncharacterized protein LOC116302127 [Actinia tenebrosa]
MSWKTTAKSFGIFLVVGALLLILFQWTYVRNVFPAIKSTESIQNLDVRRKVKTSRDVRVSQRKLLQELKLVLVQRKNTTASMESWKKKKKQICGVKWQDKYKKLHQDILESRVPPRYLVFNCGGVGYGCGGYGNRINGITSLLYLAVLTKRALLIDWKSNISITEYFSPKNIKWDFSQAKLRGLKSRHHFWGKGFHKNVPIETVRPGYTFDEVIKWLLKTDLEHYFDHEVEYISTQWYFAPAIRRSKYLGKTARDVTTKRRGHRYSLIGCAFDFLFQQTPMFKKLLSKTRKSLNWKSGIPRIGIHFRAGDVPAFRTNKKSKTPIYSALEQFFQCAKKLERLFKKIDPSLDTSSIEWFLATDTKEVKYYGEKKYPNKVTYLDIKIEHISMSDPSRLGIEGVLLDNALLAECDILIMSDSSFSRAALGMAFHSLIVNAFGDNCKY